MKKIILFIFILSVFFGSKVYSESCTGDIFGSADASKTCAELAEKEARDRGYSASCSVSTQGAPNGSTLYSPVCTINGVDGFGANLLSGWNSSNGTVVNSGWNTLSTEMRTFNNSPRGSSITSTLLATSSRATTTDSIREIERRIEQIRQQTFSVSRAMYKNQLEELVKQNPSLRSTVDTILSKPALGSIGTLDFNPSEVKRGTTTTSSSTGSGKSCFNFSRNLKSGDSGDDVSALADILYEEGLYSGNDTKTFNNEIQEAVNDYQLKYKADILDRAGLTSPTGVVGNLTRDHLNNRCRTGSASTVDDPITNAPVSIDPNNMLFRFVKISTKENGWVSWREIELYEKKVVSTTSPATVGTCYVLPNGSTNCNGGSSVSTTTIETKINILPSKITAQSFIFSGSPADVAPSKAVDGNIETAWNAGETNIPCRTPGTRGCPGAVREADFVIDLGKIKNISRIRLVENGDTITEVATVYVSNNGKDYTELTKFIAPTADRQNLDFPKKINPNAKPPVIAGAVVSKQLPTADNPNINSIRSGIVNELYNMALSLPASTTGQAVLKLKPTMYGYSPAGNFQYVWRVENADYIKIEKSIEVDPSLGVLTETESGGGCKIDKDARDASMFPMLDSSISSLNMSPLVLFGYRFTNPSLVYAPISEYANTCNIGKRYISTMTAYKSDSNKVATFKFIIEVSK